MAHNHDDSLHHSRIAMVGEETPRASEETLREIHFLMAAQLLEQLRHVRGKQVIKCEHCGMPMKYYKASMMEAIRKFLKDNRVTAIDDLPNRELLAELENLGADAWPEDVNNRDRVDYED